MRQTYVWKNGSLHPKTNQRKPHAPMVINDLEPYQSAVTGEYIDGRRAHRQHLRRYDLIEVGNESR